MLAFDFNGSSQFQKIPLAQMRGKDTNVGDNGLTFGDGSGLIQNHGIDAAALFKRFGRLKKNTKTSRTACSHHHSSGRRKTQRTRAGNHQNAHSKCQCKLNACPECNPHEGRHQSDRKHDRDKDTADFVGQTGHRRFGRCGFVD